MKMSFWRYGVVAIPGWIFGLYEMWSGHKIIEKMKKENKDLNHHIHDLIKYKKELERECGRDLPRRLRI